MSGRRRRRTRRWAAAHAADPYVRRARAEGERSRAAFKLEALDRQEGLLRPGMRVVDLGAAPGSWSAYAARRVGPRGRVVALDRLPMEPIPGVTFVQGDFEDPEVLDRLLHVLGQEPVDLVLSDMAPNLSGVVAVDQPRAMALAELALDLAGRVLRPGGALVVKVFQGEGLDGFVREARGRFGRVRLRKPPASRARSRELYLVAGNHRIV